MDRGRDPSNQEASTKRKLGETVEKIEIDMVSTSKWDTSKRPTPRRAWAVGERLLLSGTHLGGEGQELGNLGVGLVASVDSRGLTTDDYGVGVTVEGDHPIGDGVSSGQGQHGAEHDKQRGDCS